VGLQALEGVTVPVLAERHLLHFRDPQCDLCPDLARKYGVPKAELAASAVDQDRRQKNSHRVAV